MRRPASILPLVLAAAACTCQDPPAPVVTSVQPAEAPSDMDTVLTVWGANFLPAVKAEMDDPALSQVNATFALGLVRADGTQVALTGATLVSESEILATLPAGASPGTYDFRLVDPDGRVAVLASALLVYVPSCSNPLAPDGTPCNDGNLCTQVDTCQGGVCMGSSPVVCAVLDPCHPGACDPGTGLCSNPPAPDGTPCRLVCIAGETCQAGVCTLPTTGCINTAPLACLVVTPASGAAGSAGATLFTADASCSSDVENAAAGTPLTLAVDFGDVAGVFSWQASPATHAYAAAGVRTASAEVTDVRGLTTYAQVGVVVYDPSTLVLVTTAVDENDTGATPTSYGGSGFSLREAINYVNATPSPPAGPWTIGFALGPGPVSFSSALPPLTAAGATLAGYSDASGLPAIQLDFSSGNVGGSNKPCLTVDGPNQLLAWLLVTGCNGTGVLFAPGSAGSQVTQCQLEAPAGALTTSVGVSAQDSVTIGPRNLVAGWATGVDVTGSAGLVDGNTILAGGTGISVSGVPAGATLTVQRNRVYANSGAGASLGTSGGSLLVRHNLFHGNGTDGLAASGPTLVVRDNLFSENGHFGVNAAQNDFAGGAFDHNGFFGNQKAATIPPLATGPSDVLADPLYINTAAGDFRLAPDSPAVNAGVDTGLDVNGPAPGLYSGLAPDLGPEETPY